MALGRAYKLNLFYLFCKIFQYWILKKSTIQPSCGTIALNRLLGPSWSYGSWIYNYLCNRCLSPLTLWVRITLRQGVLDTTLCDTVCQWLATGLWFTLGTPVFSIYKTDRHGITEILLKVASNTITLTLILLEL